MFKSQYGFRTGHNTTHATIDFVKTIEDSLDSNEFAVGVFCDLSKAFDTINHEVLLEKLDHYGIRGSIHDWLRSYLSGREQYVELNGAISSKLPILTGVPQGSILGPLLFLIYINDLPSATTMKTILFADDSNFLIRGKNLSTLKNNLNCELENINDYFKANKLKLDAKKTKLVCFRKKSKKVDLSTLQVFLDGEQLVFEEEAQFLGIVIDSNLMWDKHCNHVSNKISRNNALINQVKKVLPPPSLKILYNSLILPHLQYGLAAWGGCSNQSKKRIINIQKRAIRTVSKSYVIAHTEPRMKKLGLLKLDELYTHQCATLVHDMHKRAPIPIIDLLPVEEEQPRYRLCSHVNNPNHLRTPITRSKIGSNGFCCKGPQVWNSLPPELQSVRSRHSFKSQLKQRLLGSYEERTTCSNPRCHDQRHHHN